MSATTTAPSTTTYPSLRAAALPLAALCLAFFVEMVDNTLLSIALPTIGRDLGSSTTALQWVTGAYSLTFGGLLLTAGSAADRFGRRRVLLDGLAAFGLISLFVVFVTGAGQLIALRAALGCAAAAMAPVTMSLIFRLFDDEKLRMRAITVVMIVGMSGFVLGPLLGGTALSQVSWQWLLVVNAPIALIAWMGVRLGCRPTGRGSDERAARPARHRLDHRRDRSRLLHPHQRRRARLAVTDHRPACASARSLRWSASSAASGARPSPCSTCGSSRPARPVAPRSPRPAPPSPWPVSCSV